MALLTWFRERRAARRYARELAPWLARSYGASEHYSVGQIRAGIGALRLDGSFAAIAYAAFMPREGYEALLAKLPRQLAYEEARDLFRRFVQPQLRSASGEAGRHSLRTGRAVGTGTRELDSHSAGRQASVERRQPLQASDMTTIILVLRHLGRLPAAA